MRQEVQLIKENIKREFPESNISVRYIQTKNWLDSSDKIKIKTNIPYNALFSYLRKYTAGIAIYPKGNIASKFHNFGSLIFGIESDAEFLEIESTDKMF